MRSPLKVLTTILAGLALATPALADDIGTSKKIGVGVGGGTLSSGLSGKMYLKEDFAVQATVGAGWGTAIGVDVVKEFPINEYEPGRLFWGAGAGAGTWLVSGYGGNIFAVSGIVQLGWHFKDMPLEVTTDIRPTFFTGDYLYSGLYLGGGGGAVRYYF